jgi:hypothetical protein
MSHLRLVALVIPVLLSGCPKPDDCTPNETRCYNNSAQICGTDQRWRTFMNCTELGGQMLDWSCCWQPGDPEEGVPAGCTCIEGVECREDEP